MTTEMYIQRAAFALIALALAAALIWIMRDVDRRDREKFLFLNQCVVAHASEVHDPQAYCLAKWYEEKGE